ncbi:hypothetical protein BC940DRAFT_300640 [Gongronella butleri]|nr:hypothetical protein BC940DRAFT_300640 [Gongronella butleri]
MIIANPLKKNICIPLQTFTPSPSTAAAPLVEKAPSTDVISSERQDHDFVTQLFGDHGDISKEVDQVLTIRLPMPPDVLHAQPHTLESNAFIYKSTAFLSFPVVVSKPQQELQEKKGLSCASADFQASVTRLIELAEEQTGCSALVVAIDKQDQPDVNAILRAYMYLGFQMVHPSIYHQNQNYILLGYEL